MIIDSKEFEKREHSSVRLTVTVSGEESSRVYGDLIKTYQRKTQIPGFRRGKVPQSVIERKFGADLRREASSNLIEEALQTALSKDVPLPLTTSYPILEGDPDFHPGESFTFTVNYDVFPEIKLGDYRNLDVEEPQVTINKKHEAAALETLREKNAVAIDKADKTVGENDVVTMDFVELDETGKAVGNTKRENFVFTPAKDTHPYGLKDEILGMKTGETKIIEKSFPEEQQDQASLADRTFSLQVSVKDVKERRLPDLDDELAKDVDENLKTLEDLKKRINQNLKDHAQAQTRNVVIQKILDALVENSEIDIPQSMVAADLEETWMRYVKNSGTSEEILIRALENDGRGKADILEQWRGDSEKSICSRLILGRIAENENIEVSKEEIEVRIAQDAEKFNTSVEDLEKTFGGPRFREYLKNEITQKKLYDFLLSVATIKKGEKIDYNVLLNG